MNASPTPTKTQDKERRKFSVGPNVRRKINNDHWQRGERCVVVQPPGKPYQLVITEKLPRASAGKPRRRGVHIPELPIMAMRPQRVSKHAKQKHRHGRFGKAGFDTIDRKQAFLDETRETANILAQERRLHHQFNRQARELAHAEALP